jgi:zinc D-Ala-D-Ala dipeptidase
MNHTRILSIEELRAILPGENGEPLINLAREDSGILCRPSRWDIMIRKSAAEKLQRIQCQLRSMNPGWQLVLMEGYRHPHVQEREYLRYFCAMARELPMLEIEALKERVHQWVALPSVAGHPTGGAIDVTLAENGQEFNMGGCIADFSCPERLPTFAPGLTIEQQRCRRLLHDLMLNEGFAPFYGEWWHYSYGDREWAAFYGHSQSLYEAILHY